MSMTLQNRNLQKKWTSVYHHDCWCALTVSHGDQYSTDTVLRPRKWWYPSILILFHTHQTQMFTHTIYKQCMRIHKCHPSLHTHAHTHTSSTYLSFHLKISLHIISDTAAIDSCLLQNHDSNVSPSFSTVSQSLTGAAQALGQCYAGGGEVSQDGRSNPMEN